MLSQASPLNLTSYRLCYKFYYFSIFHRLFYRLFYFHVLPNSTARPVDFTVIGLKLYACIFLSEDFLDYY